MNPEILEAPPPDTDAKIHLTETVWNFVVSRANVVLMYGPRGEGKSVGGMAGMIYHAHRQTVRPVKWAAVRDTWVNLRRTVLETIKDGVREGWWDAEFIQGGEEVRINGDLIHLYCFGMDTLTDIEKFQGLELSGLWIDEAAAISELSGGVPEFVPQTAITSMRQRGIDHWRLQITENAPDDDHWTMRLRDMFGEAISVEVFPIPAGENPHLPATYRADNLAALKLRPDLKTRLVDGLPGMLVVGEAVVPNFSRTLHVAPGPLSVYKDFELIRLWDAGAGDLHPAVVFIQVEPAGVNVLASRVGENIGIVEFIQLIVKPLQVQYHWAPPRETLGEGFGTPARGGFRFRDIGDPYCLVASGVSSQLTVAKAIQNAFGTSFEPGPQDWSSRLNALVEAFNRPGKGKDRLRFMQIDPEENLELIKALGGRFHYPRDPATGRILGTLEAAKRVSGQYGHMIMALAYGLGTLFPADEWVRALPARPVKPLQPPTSWLGA